MKNRIIKFHLQIMPYGSCYKLQLCYISRKFLDRRRHEEDNVAQMEEEEREVMNL